MRGKNRPGRYTAKHRSRRRGGGRTAIVLLLLLLAFMLLVWGAVYTAKRWMNDQAEAVTLESSREVVPESIPDRNIEEKAGKTRALHTLSPGAAAPEILKNMTLEEKAAQMFMITPEALTGVERVYSAGAATKELINQYPVGGLIYSPANLESVDQVKSMLDHVRQYSMERVGVTIFTSTDEKGSIHMAGIADPAYQAQKSGIGAAWASGDLERVYESAHTMGTYLNDMGFNLMFATPADVLAYAKDSILSQKHPGTGGGALAAFAVKELKGFEDAGVKMLMRYFPGHSDAKDEAHQEMPFIDKGLGGLLTDELVPFKAGIDAGVDFIMAGHIAVPSVTGDGVPSSLSEAMITNVLRENLGYQGVVVTDSLASDEITRNYTQEEAAVKAVQAGADILLTPSDFKASYRGLIHAVKTGVIPEERIDQSVLRILQVKISLNK